MSYKIKQSLMSGHNLDAVGIYQKANMCCCVNFMVQREVKYTYRSRFDADNLTINPGLAEHLQPYSTSVNYFSVPKSKWWFD